MKRPYRKFHNIKTEYDGYKFDSIHESEVYKKLKEREKLAEISDLKLQVRFPLKVNDQLVTTYIADFTYYEDGNYVVVDAKSPITAKESTFVIKKKLMKIINNIDILIVFK